MQIDGVFWYVSPGLQLLFPIFRGTTLKRVTTKKSFKKEITLDEYFEDGRTFGNRRVVLQGEVDEIRVSGNNLFINLISSEGKEISTFYDKYKWNDDDVLKNKLRSIKVGSVIKVRGYFDMESDFTNVFTILNVVNFGN